MTWDSGSPATWNDVMIYRALIISATALLLAAAAQAAEDAAAPEPEQLPAAQNEATQPAKPSPEKPAMADTPDTFTPSEEISEDLSVPFPVDI